MNPATEKTHDAAQYRMCHRAPCATGAPHRSRRPRSALDLSSARPCRGARKRTGPWDGSGRTGAVACPPSASAGMTCRSPPVQRTPAGGAEPWGVQSAHGGEKADRRAGRGRQARRRPVRWIDPQAGTCHGGSRLRNGRSQWLRARTTPPVPLESASRRPRDAACRDNHGCSMAETDEARSRRPAPPAQYLAAAARDAPVVHEGARRKKTDRCDASGHAAFIGCAASRALNRARPYATIFGHLR